MSSPLVLVTLGGHEGTLGKPGRPRSAWCAPTTGFGKLEALPSITRWAFRTRPRATFAYWFVDKATTAGTSDPCSTTCAVAGVEAPLLNPLGSASQNAIRDWPSSVNVRHGGVLTSKFSYWALVGRFHACAPGYRPQPVGDEVPFGGASDGGRLPETDGPRYQSAALMLKSLISAIPCGELELFWPPESVTYRSPAGELWPGAGGAQWDWSIAAVGLVRSLVGIWQAPSVTYTRLGVFWKSTTSSSPACGTSGTPLKSTGLELTYNALLPLVPSVTTVTH
jgi:hypothetical protein